MGVFFYFGVFVLGFGVERFGRFSSLFWSFWFRFRFIFFSFFGVRFGVRRVWFSFVERILGFSGKSREGVRLGFISWRVIGSG